MSGTYQLPLTKGTILFDADDLPAFCMYQWHINDVGYAVWRGNEDGKKKTVRLHRLVNKTPDDLVTDHKNHNRLDNRKSNLHSVTQKENMNNIDHGKGYWFHKQNSNWHLQTQDLSMGAIESEELAQELVAMYRDGYEIIKPERIECVHGHFLILGNIYIVNGKKMCKACQSNRSREYYKRKKNYANT